MNQNSESSAHYSMNKHEVKGEPKGFPKDMEICIDEYDWIISMNAEASLFFQFRPGENKKCKISELAANPDEKLALIDALQNLDTKDESIFQREDQYFRLRKFSEQEQAKNFTYYVIREAGEELRRNEKNKRLLAEMQIKLTGTSRGFWEWDFRNNYLHFSAEYYEMLSFNPEDFSATYENWLQLIHPEDQEAANERAQAWLKHKKEEYKNEFRLKTANGKWIWIKARGHVVAHDNKGNALRMVGSHEIIDKEKKAELALKKSEERYADLFYNQPIALWEEDFSDVNEMITELIKEGHKINEEYLYAKPDLVQELAYKIKIIRSNKRAQEQENYSMGAQTLINTLLELIPQVLVRQLLAIARKEKNFQMEYSSPGKQNEMLTYILNWSVLPAYEQNYSRVLISCTDITQNIKLAKKLKDSQERMQAAVEGSNDGLWDWDLQTNKAFHSERFARMLGYEPHELPYTVEAWNQLLHPDDIKMAYQEVDNYLSGRTASYESVFRMKAKDGSYKWIKGRGKFLADDEGKPKRFIGFNTDITQEVLSKNALSASEHLLKTTINSINNLIIYLSPDFRIQLANTAAAKIMGLRPERFQGSLCYELFYGRTSPCEHCPVEMAMKQQNPIAQQKIRPDGKILNRTIYPVIRDGQLHGNVVIAEDISDEVKIQEDLLRAKIKAEENEAKLKLLYHNMPNGSVQVNRDYIIESVNEVTCSITGYKKEELIGKPCGIICPKGPHKCPIFDMGKSKIDNDETFIKSKDGRLIPILKSCRRFQLHDTDIIIENFQDITQLRKMEKDLVEAKDKAEESDRLKSAFLANMSHEIRTPMNGIMGFAELLREHKLTIEEKSTYLNIIEKNGKRMLDIIGDLIDISRIEAGITEVHKEITNIPELIKECCQFFQPEAQSLGLMLSVKNNHQEISIITDRMKLHQILANLVKNAIKYTKQGSIEIGYYTKADRVHFYVKDSGIGIPKSLQEKIFERFRQAEMDLAREYEGAGLGLSICKAYVEMLGGSIQVKSEPGKGSCFSFHIHNSSIHGEIDDKSVIETEPKQEYTINSEILIAEDDEDAFFLIEQFLSKRGIICHHARNGRDAVAMASANNKYKIVLMDIKMPFMDGYEATRQIKKIRPDLKIFVQTAFAAPGDRQNAIKAGCDGFITKPLNLDKLFTLIAKNHE